MTAGKLRERLRVERRGKAPDGRGNNASVWEVIAAPRPAQVTYMRGGETVQAKKVTGTNLYMIKMRFSKALDLVRTGDRFVNDNTGQAYNIRLIEQKDERRRYFYFTAESGVFDATRLET